MTAGVRRGVVWQVTDAHAVKSGRAWFESDTATVGGDRRSLVFIYNFVNHHTIIEINKMTFKRTRCLSNAVCICHHFLNIWRAILVTFNYDSSRTSKANGHGAKWKPIGGFLYDSIVTNIVSLTAFNIFNVKDLGRFKVIQGQRSLCQSIAHGRFPIQFLLTPTSYLSPFWNIWRVIVMTLN